MKSHKEWRYVILKILVTDGCKAEYVLQQCHWHSPELNMYGNSATGTLLRGHHQWEETVHHNAYHEDPYAKEFGIKISEKLASVEARILPAPWLKYHDTGREKDCLPQVGQWNMMNKISQLKFGSSETFF
ncbi:uncharacterized protein LOC131227950 isoform X2 [Magnolia sinica]|uniref:uncharacterized protein LOC131227950 isoform X2 n=1 Tax=Magnolia sinica TaxID=86752 RepID=UPI002657BD2F|nr:uncharacterized protein LOC131227950 isoform X2 [Magnolia sinica]